MEDCHDAELARSMEEEHFGRYWTRKRMILSHAEAVLDAFKFGFEKAEVGFLERLTSESVGPTATSPPTPAVGAGSSSSSSSSSSCLHSQDFLDREERIKECNLICDRMRNILNSHSRGKWTEKCVQK